MKLKRSHETQTFINNNGMYAIKQDHDVGDDPSVIELNPDQMRAVIADMQFYLQDQGWFSLEDEPKE